MGLALEDSDQLNYWAPSVIYYEGVFYMYYSSCPKGQEDDPFAQRLKVAVADNPLGPFIFQKQLYDFWSIDPHVVEKNGELYMFYAAKGSYNGKDGTMCFLQKLNGPLDLQGASRLVLGPTISQELFGTGPEYCLEGPFYFEHNGTGFLMYSGNRWEDPDYFVGYATCDAAVPLEDAVFQKYPDDTTYNPLIGEDEYFSGCGHNSITTGPHGELLIVYHGRSKAEGDKIRRLCISEIRIDGKKIILADRR
jgi:GH43 family beta-xylosidase